jgi:hypothetical protein
METVAEMASLRLPSQIVGGTRSLTCETPFLAQRVDLQCAREEKTAVNPGSCPTDFCVIADETESGAEVVTRDCVTPARLGPHAGHRQRARHSYLARFQAAPSAPQS